VNRINILPEAENISMYLSKNTKHNETDGEEITRHISNI
jgi:hypothetical protein